MAIPPDTTRTPPTPDEPNEPIDEPDGDPSEERREPDDESPERWRIADRPHGTGRGSRRDVGDGGIGGHTETGDREKK